MSQHTLQVQFDNLISLLAEHLYADSNVFVRELIQNAHDAIVKRQMQALQHGELAPIAAIRIETDRRQCQLRIHDNGAGLTLEEIHAYLSTIGGSDKRALQSQFGALKNADRAQALRLIGQFGIGLLSAFVVAEKVEILTRCASGEAFLWSCGADGHYEVEPAQREEVGSTATLFLKPEHTRYLETDFLAPLIRNYADIIGVPIYLGAALAPLNVVNAPWHQSYDDEGVREASHRAFWEARFPREHALEVLPIDIEFEYFDPFDPPTKKGRIQGVLGITDRRIPGVDARGVVDLFVARMFIAPANRALLPPWANFIQGVLECGELSPNAARDNVLASPALDGAREALGTAIIAWLQRLASQNPQRFQTLMRWHAFSLLSMCALDENRGFFEAVARILPLQSDNGTLSMQEYLANAPIAPDGRRKVFYMGDETLMPQTFLLARARGWRVFNTAESFAEAFLQRFEATWPREITLESLNGGSHELLGAANQSDEYFALSQRASAILGLPVQISHFEPASIPVLLVQAPESQTQDELNHLARHPATPTYLRGVLSRLMTEREEPATLHLNAAHPLLGRLNGWVSGPQNSGPRTDALRAALLALHAQAGLLAARRLTPETLPALLEGHTRFLETWMETVEQLQALERENLGLKAQLETLNASSNAPATPQ